MDSPIDLLAAGLDEMAGNLVKSFYMIALTFKRRFRAHFFFFFFCTLSLFFVRLGLRFLCARLVVHSFAVHLVQ